jgi:hypothetical protein
LTKCFAYVIYWNLSPSKGHWVLEPNEIPACVAEGDHFRGPVSLTYGAISPVRHLFATESPHFDDNRDTNLLFVWRALL